MARKPRGQRVVDAYFFRDHFDDRETCGPLIALPSDRARGSDAVKGSYREVLEKLVEIFMDDLDEPQRRERALALAALCVGGIAFGETAAAGGVVTLRLVRPRPS